MYIKEYFSPTGRMIISADDNSLTKLSFSDMPCEINENHITKITEEWLDIYFSGNIPDFTPPLCPSGTAFQLMIWELLREIPYGITVSYGEIAGKAAALRGMKKMSPQAVGGAVGRNPIALIIPCHRVISGDGSLTGYRGGIDKKAFLLGLEKKVKSSEKI